MPGQLEGELDSLAWHDSGGLEEKFLAGLQPEGRAQTGAVRVRRGHRRIKIHDVGNEDGTDAGSQGKLPGSEGVDDHVSKGRQGGRKGGPQIVPGGVDGKPPSFPREIVVVPDARETRLGDQLSHRQAERDVDWQGQRVLDDQQVDLEMAYEASQVVLQMILQSLYLERDLRRPGWTGEQALSQIEDDWMQEMRFGDNRGSVWRRVALAGEVEALEAHAGENPAPLLRLTRDAIRPGQAGGDEPDVTWTIFHGASNEISSTDPLRGT